jgi:antitoxin MazE
LKTIIKKWGNSFAIRIPKAIIDDANLEINSEIEISLKDGQITLVPVKEKNFTLESLVAGITNENQHGEIDTGYSVGNEVD